MASSGGGGRGGFGRGGRGAALLQALADRKKPGGGEHDVKPLSVPATQPTPAGAAPPATAPATAAPLGRGSLLAGLKQQMLAKQQLQQQQAAAEQQQAASQQQPPSAMQAPDEPVKPMGRGLAAMKALLAQKQASAGRGLPQGAPLGRGMSGPTTAMASARSDQPIIQPTSARQSQASSECGDPPTQQMSEVSLDRSRGEPFRGDQMRRPAVEMHGDKGKPVSLSANYVRLLCNNEAVHQYHVSFKPIIDNKRLKIRLLGDHKGDFKTGYSFDGSVFYLPYKLDNRDTQFTSIRKTDGTAVTITVSYVKVLPPAHCKHLYNVTFRRIMYILDMCQVQRYFYNPHTPAMIPQRKLEVWPGYITAVEEQEGGLMLLLDASHKVLRTETVHDIMQASAVSNPNGFKEDCYKKIVGAVVLTRYNNKTYKVDDILWSKTPADKFANRTGEEISFVEYYKTQHNITIQNDSQPLLLHKRRPDKGAPPGTKPDPEFLCLIPELCFMCGLTDEMRADFSVMKDLAVHTRVTPAQRQNAMRKFVNSVNNSPEACAELATWGLELDKSTVEIAGRRLAPEMIKMGGNREFSAGNQADWSRDACRNTLLQPVNLINWGVFFTRRDAAKANDFIKHMQTETRNMGINCQPPFRKELANEKIETLVQELRSSINPEVQMVVCINPTNRDDRYSAIKKLCCVECPVPSQVIVARTISKPDKLRSVVQKIALQINCKLGGELWEVRIPLKGLMVVGIDSYHDATRGKQSVGGVVCSLNKNCTRWYSSVSMQRPGEELVHGLQMCLTNGLRKYYDDNHELPEKIIVFRDGVGDGQLDVLADHEVKQLQRCFLSFGAEYQPKCATVIVQKRINTRIFSKARDGSVDNPGPGTVVDHSVTRRDRYDFFIVSQHVRQGTVSPTHYIVIDDSLGLPVDHMQALTYKMTHLYYNWPGTVRVPAPCQYAHKLAYLVGENIHKAPSPKLSDRLFFL